MPPPDVLYSHLTQVPAVFWRVLSQEVNQMERTRPVLAKVNADPRIRCQFPPKNSLEGATLDCAVDAVAYLVESKSPMIFKIGITCDPFERFYVDGYGYNLSYTNMTLLQISHERSAAAWLEAALIKWFWKRPGLQNEKKGGEGPQKTPGPHFTYVVWKQLL